ncbi:hypothetical protein L596_006122 [Steinernema carpocapsae]|uniref:Bestrophin homolog n=1 Tax=Steinernema carpocapsae TaxID=34508 RepID=A0A4U8V2P9_STECR|nr:hypothetical protein L596_006122 [Steinernema carpocapsae]
MAGEHVEASYSGAACLDNTLFYAERVCANFLIVRQELGEWLNRIPLIFLLGFFVSVVFNRWVDIFKHIGFIDNLALHVAAILNDSGCEMRLIRRNIIRYAVLSQTLVFRDISLQVRKRFPNNEAIVESDVQNDNYSFKASLCRRSAKNAADL